MGKAAARMGDQVKQDAPHCHAPIHPAAPVPTPVPHPALPLAIIKGEPTVLIGGKAAARVTDTTKPCTLPSCVPGGPRDDRERFGHGPDRRFAGRPGGRHDGPLVLCGAHSIARWEDPAARVSDCAHRRLTWSETPPFRNTAPGLPGLPDPTPVIAHYPPASAMGQPAGVSV